MSKKAKSAAGAIVYVVNHKDYGFCTGPYWRKHDAERAMQANGVLEQYRLEAVNPTGDSPMEALRGSLGEGEND